MGIGLRMLSLIWMPLIGITQGFSTIVGFNYRAKLYPRMFREIRSFNKAILDTV
jgi:Na+-driven multidrug efflux pump